MWLSRFAYEDDDAFTRGAQPRAVLRVCRIIDCSVRCTPRRGFVRKWDRKSAETADTTALVFARQFEIEGLAKHSLLDLPAGLSKSNSDRMGPLGLLDAVTE
jgi:hypothetical protein